MGRGMGLECDGGNGCVIQEVVSIIREARKKERKRGWLGSRRKRQRQALSDER